MKSSTPVLAQAAEICTAYERRGAVLRNVGTFDAETESRKGDFAAKIRAADSGSFDDVAGIQTALNLKEQLRRFEIQRAADREGLVEQVRRDAAKATAGVDIPGFFQRALENEIASCTAAMLPFFENEVRARGAAGQADSVNALGRWSRQLVHEVPAEIIAQRLATYVSEDRPLWKI